MTMSDSTPLRLAVIIGSTRNGRFGPTAAAWIASHACKRQDLDVDVIDLAEARLPEVLTDHDETVPDPVQALAPRLTAADAFIIVTPEYNRSFPAPLKTAIDWFYEEWQAKPVTFVSYGRESGGLHATAQLRQVFSELHSVTIRSAVSLPCYWQMFAADGTWPTPTAMCNDAVKPMLDELTWWAYALREARSKHPYAH
jgi:NAD(P)H-dependent FMN reductase